MIKTGNPVISIYTEMTPNPETMKFVANKLLYPGKSIDLQDVESAKPSPLATELFGFPFIKAVFIASNFVTLTKTSETEWSDVIPAIRQVILTRGQMPIQSLSDQYFLSSRQFTRAFSEYAGFSPKLFSRLLRFEHTLSEYGNKDKSLTDIAYDCGYYDQSHFIHEFKEFSGHDPRHYFSGNAEGTQWKD